MEGQASAVVTAVNTLISSAAADATSLITTNAPIIGAVVAGMVILRYGFKMIKQIR